MTRPLTLGAGNDPEVTAFERTLDNKLDFRDPNGTWPTIRLQLADGEIEVIADPEGTASVIGTIPGGGGGSLSFPCEDLTAGGTLAAGTRAAIMDDTGVTLPGSPSNGAFVHLRNVGGSAGTVGRNGNDIDGAAADYSLAAGASVLLVFHATTFGGWRSFPGSGGGGGEASVWREFDATPGFLVPTSGRRVVMPWDYTITGWAISSTEVGNATFDVRRATSLSGGLSSIVASAPPTITSNSTAESTTLTGWTTTGNAGDVLVIDLATVAGFSGIRLSLSVTTS